MTSPAALLATLRLGRLKSQPRRLRRRLKALLSAANPLCGRIDPEPVQADINNYETFRLLGDLADRVIPGRCDPDGRFDVLVDWNDWDLIDLDVPLWEPPGATIVDPAIED